MARTKTQKSLRKAERAGTWSAVSMRKTNEDYSSLSQHVSEADETGTIE